MYHHSVGNNGVLELDFAIDRDGLVHPAHAEQYKQLGSWIRACYGSPLANATANSTTATISFSTPVTIDRFMLQEAFEDGERVRSWSISVTLSSALNHLTLSRQHGNSSGSGTLATDPTAAVWQNQEQHKRVANGTVIGYKQIVLLDSAVEVMSATLTVDSAVSTPAIRTFAAFKPCPTN